MKRVFGYIRVSSMGQVNGNGLDRQKENILEYARVHGLETVCIFGDEGVSGATENRNALNDLLLTVKSGDTVIIEKLDRLSRDLMIQETVIKQLQAKGVIIHSVKDGVDLFDEKPERVMIRQILGAVYQYDKAQIVEKMKVAREKIKNEGKKCEGRKSISEKHPELVETVKKYAKIKRFGKNLSNEQVATELNNDNIPSHTGKPWTRGMVRNVLSK